MQAEPLDPDWIKEAIEEPGMSDPFQQGYQAWLDGQTAYTNPYWPDYGKQKDKTPDEEQIRARRWVDGYCHAIRDYPDALDRRLKRPDRK